MHSSAPTTPSARPPSSDQTVLLDSALEPLRTNSQFKDNWISWVSYKESLFYAIFPKTAFGPSSATVKLIQGIFDNFIDHSFFILRNRIYTTEPASPLNSAMVSLAAKRIQANTTSSQFFNDSLGRDLVQIGEGTQLITSKWAKEPEVSSADPEDLLFTSQSNAMTFVQQLAMKVPRGKVLHDHDRAIAAVALDQNGKLLGSSTNQNHLNKTLHAEVCLAQNYFRKTLNRFPVGSQIFASLKPCRMCSEVLYETSEDPKSLRIFYLENDPGRLAKGSRLEQYGNFHRLELTR